jgi:hypothetical protein
LLFDSDAVFYPDKQQGTEFRKRFRDLTQFWDIDGDSILFETFSGYDIADDNKTVPTVEVLFGFNTATAQLLVDVVPQC